MRSHILEQLIKVKVALKDCGCEWERGAHTHTHKQTKFFEKNRKLKSLRLRELDRQIFAQSEGEN